MWTFAMTHEFLFFFLTLAFIGVCGRVVRSFVERHKPACRLTCQDEDDDDHTDDEYDKDKQLIAAGGEEEDTK